MRYFTWILILFCIINGFFSIYMIACFQEHTKKIDMQNEKITILNDTVERYQKDVEVYSDIIINNRWD